jgi:(p)ppGpp synthase/HD superfamily hydrolase
LSQANRVETMAEKLAVYATRAHVQNVDLVSDAYHIAMAPRLQFLPDVFHPDMLHPARTALILIENAGCTDARLLAAAQVTETRCPELRVGRDEIAALGGDVAQIAGAVPNPLDCDADTLVERLVTADREIAILAVAERLDHARHLHMRDRTAWRDYFDETVAVYLPLADRVQDELARRLERWASAFERRLI